MAANPILAADGWTGEVPAARWSYDEMRAYCGENNALKLFRELGRWYYVDTIDHPAKEGEKINEFRYLEGPDAEAARKLIRGKLQDFVGWDQQRMDGYRAWLRSCIRRGMSDEQHAALRQKGLPL